MLPSANDYCIGKQAKGKAKPAVVRMAPEPFQRIRKTTGVQVVREFVFNKIAIRSEEILSFGHSDVTKEFFRR